jgi:hypothetical protein
VLNAPYFLSSNFRPSYVISPAMFSGLFAHKLNKGASGVSYILTDANSDGVVDHRHVCTIRFMECLSNWLATRSADRQRCRLA